MAKKVNNILCCTRQSVASRLKADPCPLLGLVRHACSARSRVRMLSTRSQYLLQQVQCRATKMIEGPDLRGVAVRAESAQPGEEKAQGDLFMCINTWQRE